MSAIDDLRFLEKRFRGILDLIPQLEKISTLDNHVKELEKKKNDLISLVEAEEASMGFVLDKKNSAASEAAGIIEAAKGKAETIVSAAKDQADAIIENADSEALSLKNEAETAFADIGQKVAEQKKILAALEAEREAKQSSVSYLNSELAKLKSKL